MTSDRYYAPGHVLPNGAMVLRSAQEQGTDRPFVVVLAQKLGEFITWVVRPSDQVAFSGHYFTDLGAAMLDFDSRVESGGSPPVRQGAWGSMTLTAGEIVRHLSRFDPDTPVTIGVPDEVVDKGCSEWLNIEGFGEYRPGESVSIIIETADDYDSRQW